MKITRTYDNILCVIPARAGSQGIIDKNLQLIWGMPLVEHSIIHALDAGLNPEQIFVSSDSDIILDIALRNQVIAHKRPPSISGALSSTEEALLDVLENHLSWWTHDLAPCEHVLLLQPTSPIRFKGTLNRFLDFYINSEYDSAFTATKFYDFFWRIQDDKFVGSHDPENRPMRQEMTPYDFCFFENGSMYLTSCEILQDKKCRIGGNVGIFTISELEGMQIDTPEDLEIFCAVFSGEIPKKVGLK